MDWWWWFRLMIIGTQNITPAQCISNLVSNTDWLFSPQCLHTFYNISTLVINHYFKYGSAF